MYIITVQQ